MLELIGLWFSVNYGNTFNSVTKIVDGRVKNHMGHAMRTAFRREKQFEVSTNEGTRARVHARARVRFSTSAARPTVLRALH